jgi:hypothetical protein
LAKDETVQMSLKEIAERHSVSLGAVEAAYVAIQRGNGTMAQFSHPDFGGMAQWTPSMSMVGDMFNAGMKMKLDGVCHDVAALLRTSPPPSDRYDAGETREVSYRSSQDYGGWWPTDLGSPSSTGSQNDLHYAIFGRAQRLAIKDRGHVSIYDTGSHVISGISQAQSGDQTLSFSSQDGLVRLSKLKRVS